MSSFFVSISNCRRMTRCALFGKSFLVVVCLILLGSCQLPAQRSTTQLAEEQKTDAYNSARINCFLHLKDDRGPAIRLEIASIEVLADNIRVPLTNGPLTIDAAEIGTGQVFLGNAVLPPARYNRLLITINKGELRQASGNYGVIAPGPFLVELNLYTDLRLEPEDSRTLLLTWDVQNSLQTDNTLNLALTAGLPLKQMLFDLVFVTCPNIDTVFVVRPDKNWVVDSFGIKGRPTYLAIDPIERQFLYILAAGDRMVKVIDLASYRLINFFAVPLNDQPTFMTISPDGQAAFLLDTRSGYLSRMNLTSGLNVARVMLGYRPEYVAYLEEQDLLAVSLSLSQQVVLLDPLNLKVVGNISTGSKPHGLAVSDSQLVIAEYGDDSVSVTDLASMRSQTRLSVGFGPHRLLEANNQFYVTNYKEGSLSILVPDQLGVIKEIYGLISPQEMAYNQSYRRLYVTDQEAAALAVIDVNSNLLLGSISLGAKPFGLAVIQ